MCLASLRFRAQCSRGQWWWTAEILASFTAASNPTDQLTFWMRFLPPELVTHRVDTPPGFLPSLRLVDTIERTWETYAEIDHQLAVEGWLIDGMLAELRDENVRLRSRGG